MFPSNSNIYGTNPNYTVFVFFSGNTNPNYTVTTIYVDISNKFYPKLKIFYFLDCNLKYSRVSQIIIYSSFNKPEIYIYIYIFSR